MPTLPGLTINDQAVWDRVLAAFDNDIAKFKAWQKHSLQEYVQAQEAQKINTSNLLDGAT